MRGDGAMKAPAHPTRRYPPTSTYQNKEEKRRRLPSRNFNILLAFILFCSLLLPSQAFAAVPAISIVYSDGKAAYNQGAWENTANTTYITYTLTPGYSAASAVWSAATPNVVSIDQTDPSTPHFTGLKEGATTITLTVVTTSGDTLTDSFNFSTIYNDYDAAGTVTGSTQLLRTANTPPAYPAVNVRATLPVNQTMTVLGRCNSYYYVSMPAGYVMDDGSTGGTGFVLRSQVKVSPAKVTFTPSSFTLVPKQTTVLSVAIAPVYADRALSALTWKSANANVVTIVSVGMGSTTGMVTLSGVAAAASPVAITATTASGISGTAQIKVNAFTLKLLSTDCVAGSANVNSNLNKFSFSAVPGATQYTITRTGDATAMKTWTVTTTTFSDTTTSYRPSAQTAPFAYTYKVTANVDGSPSATKSIYPGQVMGPGAVPVFDGAVSVTWTPEANAAGYRIYRRLSTATSYSILTDVSGAATKSYTDKAVAAGKTYVYRISAYTLSGATKYIRRASMPEVSAKPYILTLVSSACVAGTANVNTNINTLTFEAFPGATSYRVYRRKFSDSSYPATYKTITATTAKTYTFSDTTTAFKSGSTLIGYRYLVVAYKGTTKLIAAGKNLYPGQVQNLKATAATGFSAQVKLTWTPVANAYGYYVYRSGGKTFTVIGGASASYVDTTVVAERQYNYQVAAYTLSSAGTAQIRARSSVATVKVPPLKYVSGSSLTSSYIYPFENTYSAFNNGKYSMTSTDQNKFVNKVWDKYGGDYYFYTTYISDKIDLQYAVAAQVSSSWNGSCYGMSSSIALNRLNQINMRTYTGSSGTSNYLNKVSYPKNSLSVKSAINYYQLSQYVIDDNVSYYSSYNSNDWKVGLKDIVTRAKSNKLQLFCFSWNTGAHAILIRGYKDVSNGNYRLTTYDPNYPASTTYVYVSSDYMRCGVTNEPIPSI